MHPSSDLAEKATRLGWLAKGLVFATIGALGIEIARRGTSGDDADQTGALAALAGVPAGRVLVFVVAVGLVLFAVWKFWAAAVGDSETPLDVAKRVGTFGLGCSYALLGVTGVQIALNRSGSSSGGGATSPETIARFLLGVPAGRGLLIGIGLGTFAVGAYHLWKGISVEFLDDIDTKGLSPVARRSLAALGMFGFAARATMLGIAGFLLVSSALNYNPDEAAGLDESLRTLASAPFGRWLLGLASVGLIAAGVYDAVTFRRQQLD